jgi:hypothetical protein
MTAAQIFEAYMTGRLNELLGREVRPDPTTGGVDNQLTEDDLRNLSPQAIVRALGEGRLNELLGRPAFAPAGGW